MCCRPVPCMQWYMPLCARVYAAIIGSPKASVRWLRFFYHAGIAMSALPCTTAAKVDKSALQN